MRTKVLRFLVVSVLIISLFAPINTARAASFVVTSSLDLADFNQGDNICQAISGECTLRAAIQQANALAGDDTITLPAGTYTLAIPGIGEDASATGDLDITRNLTITGAGAGTTIIQAGTLGVGGPPNGIDRVIHIVSGASSVSISGVTIRNGNIVGADGGGLYSMPSLLLSITGCVFSGNSTSTNGGGIYLNAGELNLTNSTISGNSAGMGGGGLLSNGGFVTIKNSTFSGNQALSIDFGHGGGILNGNQLTIANSTFSGNSAVNNGGALYNASSHAITITSTTFSGNSALVTGGGIYNNGSTLTLSNTIVANSASGGNCSGAISNGGNNIDNGATCAWGSASGSMSSTNPRLGTLSNNGGSTQTIPLLVGSPAINAGNDTLCADAPVNGVDQRGILRPQGEHCDIGAYEGFKYQVLLPLVNK